MVRQPDPSTARAVIVGVENYVHLDPLPAVTNNVARLGELLRDPGLWGLADEHCRILLNPGSERDVLDAVHEAASEAAGFFLLYFAGHGLRDHTENLQLALPDTSKEHIYRALSYDRLRSVLLKACRADHKVIIIDSCFSGLAVGGMGSPDVADYAEVDGTFLLTSSAGTRISMAPVGARYTLFTGELLKVLEQGDPSADDLLDMDTIYRAVARALRAASGPAPQQRARNGGARITFVRNRAHIGPLRDSVFGPLPGGLPQGYHNLLHETVPGLLAQLELTAKEQADAALLVVAERWPEQQTAALLTELARVGRERQADVAVGAVVGRPAQEVAACLDVLEQLGAWQLIGALLKALIRTGPTAVARVAGKLREHGTTMAERLVRAALAEGGPAGSADLVTALYQRGLGDEALSELRTLMSGHPDPRYVGVADALLAGGATSSAYELYAELPVALATTRRPEDTARLLASMADNGARGRAVALLDSLLGVPGGTGAVHWALALHAVGLDWADEIARKELGTAAVDDVLRVLEQVRRSRPGELPTVVRWAIDDARSTADIVAFTTALREYGLPLDALRILTETADADLEKAAALISALRPGRDDEAAKLLARAYERPLRDRILFVTALRRHGADQDARPLLADVLARHSAADLLAELSLLSREIDLDDLLAHFAAAARGEHLGPLLFEYWESGRHADAERLLCSLTGDRLSLLAGTLEEFTAVRSSEPIQLGEPLVMYEERTRRAAQSRAWLATAVSRLGSDALVHLTEKVATTLPSGAASFSRQTPLGAVVAASTRRVPLPVLLALVEAHRERDAGLPHPTGMSPLLWVLGTALSSRADAQLLLSHLFEDRRHVLRIPDELRELMRTVPCEDAAHVYLVLARGGPLHPAALSGLGDRPDLPGVLARLHASGLSRGEALRIRRAGLRPWQYGVAVKVVMDLLEQTVGLYTVNVLTGAAGELEPHSLGELIGTLGIQRRVNDLDRVVASAAAQRGPLAQWLPDVLVVLRGARLDDLAARVIQKAVRCSPTSDAAAVVDGLREDGLCGEADLVEEANRHHRMTRWLHR
ncbi:hypothetical protein DI272_08435 [Streptomyces sp. Act143]|uniref:caspase, EACC1-associated type n=1 Tax=Streptomyces sp. Act143 TaxID=2200760 RepID=UPI000D676FF0|nr:caspase family protein [Streptomyces sp. Act143]PWI14179.1 hypothetical protein DI272_08435 [Streptomyces sp. Act143]